MADTEYVGLQPLPADGYLQPRKYRITCRCMQCYEEYTWETTKLTKRDKPCPNPICKEALRIKKAAQQAKNFAAILEHGPPALTGNNNMVKAVDTTADIVMRDHGLTDLKDNIRPGESMAPKLPKPMQDAADNFFGGGNIKSMEQNRRFQNLGARAIAGAFRGNAVNPNQVLGRKPGESALTHVGTEHI